MKNKMKLITWKWRERSIIPFKDSNRTLHLIAWTTFLRFWETGATKSFPTTWHNLTEALIALKKNYEKRLIKKTQFYYPNDHPYKDP